MKILIAEDDEVLAREIQMACTRWGFTVDTVQDFQLVRLADVVALADALHLDQGLRGVRGLLPYQAPGNILRKLLCFFRHY